MKIIKKFSHLTTLLILLGLSYIPPAYAACGGVNERACCLSEQTANRPACDAELVQTALGQYPGACGIFGASTCLPKTAVTACGGEGQRSCCAGEGPVCNSGLVYHTDALPFDQYEAVSGDASCGGLVINGSRTKRSLGVCISQEANGDFPDPADIDEPTTGWQSTNGSRGLMNGYHDMHIHLFADLSHGGKVLSGLSAPVDDEGDFVLNATYNVNTALSAINDKHLHKSISHGLDNDTAGDGTQDGTRSWFGAPYFNGWPKWTSTTHQQMYYVWLERAWRGGLRSTSMLAVHNEALCKTSLKDTKEESWPLCEDSMSYIVDQLKAAFKFQNFIDEQSGGEGKGWFQIVKTPEQARKVIREGNLAVILGIEVDNLFNCKEIKGCPEDFGLPSERIASLTSLPEPRTVEEAVNVLHDIGVVHVLPVHNFDNGFGGSATWHDAIGVGQVITEERWWEVEECDSFDGGRQYGYWIDPLLYPILLSAGFGIEIGDDERYANVGQGFFPKGVPSCNKYGLLGAGNSQLHPGGERLINALMDKGMLIDIDHMSRKSIDDTLDIVKTGIASTAEPYPLVASHVLFTSMHYPTFEDNKGRHERMRTRGHVDAIRDTGGIIAVMLKDDVQDTDFKGKKFTRAFTGQDYGNSIADNCRHSSKTFAQALQYATDVMGGPVTLGSDFNGAAGHLGPRFGSDACGGWHINNLNGHERVKQIAENNKISYPFTLPGYGKFNKQKTGFKSFDYNVDGLAHVGLLPDMVADLKKIGLHSHYLDQLFCSSEAYIRVWERAQAFAKGESIPDRNRAWQCNYIDKSKPVSRATISPDISDAGWYGRDAEITISATHESGIANIFYRLIYPFNPNPTYFSNYSGDNVTLIVKSLSHRDLNRLEFYAVNNNGIQEELNTLNFYFDRDLPFIGSTQRSPLANADGWNNSTVSVSYGCGDALSGIKFCTPEQFRTREGKNQFLTGTAVDKANNVATTQISGINIDLTAPVITSTHLPPANAAGWNNSRVAVNYTCTDALSDVKSCSIKQYKSREGKNQVSTGEAVDKADNRATTRVFDINIDLTAPKITSTKFPPANVDGWNNSRVTASYTCTDALSGVKSCTGKQAKSREGINQQLTGEAVDKADNRAATKISGINIDLTAPTITSTRSPLANTDSWNNSAVSVKYACTDALSGVKSCTPKQSKSGEGKDQLSTGEAVDKAGHRATTRVSDINIDLTAPTITSTRSPLANANGWNNSTVFTQFNCSDSLSGVKLCTHEQSISSEGTNQSITGQAMDYANNDANTAITGINIDITPPTVNITGVTDAETYTLGHVPVADCTTSDELSGVAANATVSITGGSSNNVGSFSVNCAGARDVADNTGSASANYDVHYAFTEILISGRQRRLPKIRAGRVVPLNFGLNGDFGLDVLQSGSPSSVKVNCSTGAVEGLEKIAVTRRKKGLSYSLDSALYQYKWKSARSWRGSCRRFLLKLDDGTTHSSDFRF